MRSRSESNKVKPRGGDRSKLAALRVGRAGAAVPRHKFKRSVVSATSEDPRTYTEAEVVALAKQGKKDPASLTPAEIRAIALYVQSKLYTQSKR